MIKWIPLEFGVRDKRTGETAWTDLRSVRDAVRRLAVVLRYYLILGLCLPALAVQVTCLTSDDCSDTIQSALDRGGIVELSPCEYKLAKGLSVPSNTRLTGVRGGTRLKMTPAGLPFVKGMNGAIVFVAVTNASVHSLTIDATASQGNGIVIAPDANGVPSQSITVSDCEIIGREDHHYHIWSLCGRHITIKDNSVDGRADPREPFKGHEGIEVYGGYDVSITGNRVIGVNGHGFNIGSQQIPATETRWPASMDTSVRFVRLANNFSSGCKVGVYIGSNNETFLPMTQIHVVNNQVDYMSDIGIKVTAATPTNQVRLQIDELLIDSNTADIDIFAQPKAKLGKIRLGRNFGDVRIEGAQKGVIIRR